MRAPQFTTIVKNWFGFGGGQAGRVADVGTTGGIPNVVTSQADQVGSVAITGQMGTVPSKLEVQLSAKVGAAGPALVAFAAVVIFISSRVWM